MDNWFIILVTLCLCAVILSALAKQDTKKTPATEEMCRYTFYTLLHGIEKMRPYEESYYKQQIDDHWEYYVGRVDHKKMIEYRQRMQAAFANRRAEINGKFLTTVQ